MRQKKWIACLLATFSCLEIKHIVSAESFLPGGSAEQTAIEAYENWMQFADPDVNTPAIDEDGCLNYALAKMAIRYNLPVADTNALANSYIYYTTFTDWLLSSSSSKMQHIAEAYSDYLTQEESIWLSGDIQERIEKTYSICAESGDSAEWCYVLQMKTASGSDHFVLTDHIDLENHKLYLLDSGSQYTSYLGDKKTLEKGYFITAVHPFHIQNVPGDCNGDMQLTEDDAVLLLEQIERKATSPLIGDADHNGIVNVSDAVYIAKVVWYQTKHSVSCDIEIEDSKVVTSTPITKLQKEQPSEIPDGWNSQIFQKQLTNDLF